MPKVGPFKTPNYDIDRVTDLIEEVGSRVSVTEGAISEETFQEEYLQKAGGTYNSYRYDMDLYGFINRARGSDDVTITSLFVNVADPLRGEQRKKAIATAAENVPVFSEMFSGGFGRNPGKDDLRIWLVEDQKVSRDKLDDSKLDTLIKLYDRAYPYLELAMSEKNDQHREAQRETATAKTQKDKQTPQQTGATTSAIPKGENVIHIDGLTLELEGDKVEDEWERAKATIDAYLESNSAS